MDVTVNGATLHAEQAGEGPSVVFVHGMCGDAEVWADQVSWLADEFRCISYDRRGHSRSSASDSPETVELHADDLAGLIAVLDLAPVVVVGSSGGARVVLDLIRRHQHLVGGAVLSEPPVGALAPELFASMIAEVAPKVERAAQEDGPRAAVDAFFGAVCPGLWSQIDEGKKERYRDNAPALFADLAMPAYQVTQDDVARIEVPTLVVAGTSSHPALRTAASTLAQWLPRCSFLELDCGHVTYAERPKEFARAVASFAAGLRPFAGETASA